MCLILPINNNFSSVNYFTYLPIFQEPHDILGIVRWIRNLLLMKSLKSSKEVGLENMDTKIYL